MHKPDRKPYWQSVTDEALADPARLARVFAGMGFTTYFGAIPWGAHIRNPPAYARGLAARLHGFAALNRSLRDADLHLVGIHPRLFHVSGWDGSWWSRDMAQRGDDLASLGALMWGCGYGQAAFRIAQIIGVSIPRVAPIGRSRDNAR
jgi:hypothetical protein